MFKVFQRALLAACLILPTAGLAQAAGIKVLVVGAFEGVLKAFAPDFEKQSGHTLAMDRGTAGQLKGRIDAGEAFDLIVITPAILGELAKDGKVIAESQAKVATVGVGVGVKEGAPKPDISSVEAFKQTLLAAKAVTYIDPASGGSSGIYIDKLLDRLGIAAEVRPKVKLKNGGHAADYVASGEADIVLQQASEILPVKGVTLVGPLPAEIQNVTTYSAAVSTKAKDPAAAQALLKALSSPQAAQLLQAKGMQQPTS
jgi:molybdate transport system substrate-binding protein